MRSKLDEPLRRAGSDGCAACAAGKPMRLTNAMSLLAAAINLRSVSSWR
jgi:hypothetical protein